jgi:hypothetical protein
MIASGTTVRTSTSPSARAAADTGATVLGDGGLGVRVGVGVAVRSGVAVRAGVDAVGAGVAGFVGRGDTLDEQPETTSTAIATARIATA